MLENDRVIGGLDRKMSAYANDLGIFFARRLKRFSPGSVRVFGCECGALSPSVSSETNPAIASFSPQYHKLGLGSVMDTSLADHKPLQALTLELPCSPFSDRSKTSRGHFLRSNSNSQFRAPAPGEVWILSLGENEGFQEQVGNRHATR